VLEKRLERESNYNIKDENIPSANQGGVGIEKKRPGQDPGLIFFPLDFGWIN